MAVTAADVRMLIDTSIEDTVIDFHATQAIAFLDSITWNDTLDATVRSNLELWMTAHFIAISIDRTAMKEKVGESSIDYVQEFGTGLNATRYGQMAISLDPTNTLVVVSKMKLNAAIKAVESFD